MVVDDPVLLRKNGDFWMGCYRETDTVFWETDMVRLRKRVIRGLYGPGIS